MGTCRRLPCRSIAHFPLITVVTVGLAIAPNNKKSSIGSVARPETKPSFPLDLANGEGRPAAVMCHIQSRLTLLTATLCCSIGVATQSSATVKLWGC